MSINYIEDSKFNKINESFAYELFNEIKKLLGNVDSVYTQVREGEYLEKLKKFNYTTDKVLIQLRDGWHMQEQKNFKETNTVFEWLSKTYPDKTFYVLTDYANPELIINFENIVPLSIGTYISDDVEYKKLLPVDNKKFEGKHAISLNRNLRMHRLMLLSYIFGKGYNNNISLSALQLKYKCNNDLMDIVDWEFKEDQYNIRDYCIDGFKQLCASKDVEGDEPYTMLENTETVVKWCNAENFDKRLRLKYENTAVEIISETSFSTPTGLTTEKYLNSVYGFNFPIVIGFSGLVNHLRNFGFDMFDDIIDHSYDTISNDTDRLVKAIELNKEILTNKELAVQLWQSNKQRFISNYNFAKKEMYNKVKNKLTNEITTR